MESKFMNSYGKSEHDLNYKNSIITDISPKLKYCGNNLF